MLDISLHRRLDSYIFYDNTSIRALSFTSFLEETERSFIKKKMEFLIDETAGPSTLGSNCRFLI